MSLSSTSRSMIGIIDLNNTDKPVMNDLNGDYIGAFMTDLFHLAKEITHIAYQISRQCGLNRIRKRSAGLCPYLAAGLREHG
jgi:hypothetical protein